MSSQQIVTIKNNTMNKKNVNKDDGIVKENTIVNR